MLLDIIRPSILAFISIFIAIDIIGNIPLFLSLSEKFSHKQKKKIIRESALYTLVISIIFIFIVKYVLQVIGITISDFKIAGGVLVLLLSIKLLLSKQTPPAQSKKYIADLGILPAATSLIARPALFAMSLIILGEFGILITLIVLTFNMFLCRLVLEKSEIINKLIGEKGINLFSKILEILLTTIAIMMIRQGVTEIFTK